MKLCAECNTTPTDTAMHTYCGPCLLIRQRRHRKEYKEHQRARGIVPVKTGVVACQEQKAFKAAQRAARMVEVVKPTLLTDHEQEQINMRIDAARPRHLDIGHVMARHIVGPAAWLLI